MNVDDDEVDDHNDDGKDDGNDGDDHDDDGVNMTAIPTTIAMIIMAMVTTHGDGVSDNSNGNPEVK